MPAPTRKGEPALLPTIFDFTPACLQANAAGRITELQKRRMWRLFWASQHLHGTLRWSVLGGALSVPPVLFSVWEYLPLILLALAALGLPSAVTTLHHYLTLQDDLKHQRVARVAGMVVLSAKDGTPPRFIIQIHDQRFEVESAEFCAFRNGIPYCLYYLAHSRYILSVKALTSHDTLT